MLDDFNQKMAEEENFIADEVEEEHELEPKEFPHLINNKSEEKTP